MHYVVGNLPSRRLWGEDVPVWVPFVLALVGAFSFASVNLLYETYHHRGKKLPSSSSGIAVVPRKPPVVRQKKYVKKQQHHVAKQRKKKLLASKKPLPPPVRKVHDCPPLFLFYFGSNQWRRPLNGSKRQVQKLIAWLRKYPKSKLLVRGHSSPGGSSDYNLLLSYRRARAVAKLFVKQGFPRSRIRVRALGQEADDEIVVSKQVAKSRKYERRVALLVIAKDLACKGVLLRR